MSMIDSIVNFKQAEMMTKVQYAVAAKVLNITQDQGQLAVDLVNAAAENMAESIKQFAGDLNGGFDTYA